MTWSLTYCSIGAGKVTASAAGNRTCTPADRAAPGKARGIELAQGRALTAPGAIHNGVQVVGVATLCSPRALLLDEVIADGRIASPAVLLHHRLGIQLSDKGWTSSCHSFSQQGHSGDCGGTQNLMKLRYSGSALHSALWLYLVRFALELSRYCAPDRLEGQNLTSRG